ncbi:hypothetical protein LIER_36908 [Lithospermum erythrorhizon]|uniref:NAC domain-containing protein n=1 Tax=Lithospermum erythrorhizon TaxID=34254 RepID=A0AAV3PCF4_LITER
MEGDVVVVNEGDDLKDLPPGFRFHPTDEEIITNYLMEKVMNNRFTAKAIGELDLNKCEPWDLPKKAKMGEKEYFFFCQRDRKYPTGMRTNRATESGYWKATGKDKEIFKGKGNLVGMKKTLVFYKGRAPKGEKTNWVMHEFRLEGKFSYYSLPKNKEEWVVSKVFHKMVPKRNPIGELIRMDSFVNHLLDNPSLPGLIEMNSADETAEYSNFTNGEEEIKGLNNSSLARTTNENFFFNVSSSPGFNNQTGKMVQYQTYNNNNNYYYQASSSNTSAPNPILYPHNTYQNTELANQNQEIRPGKFAGFNPGPGNFSGYNSGPGLMKISNQAFSQAMIWKDCKVEQFSTNNSIVSHSQETGLSTDFGPPEISSVVSKPDDNLGSQKAFDEGLEYLSSGTNIADLDSCWDY